VGKEARSLDNLFMFRESEKISKKTPRGSFFVYPFKSEKDIKVYSFAFSCFFERDKELKPCSLMGQDKNRTKSLRNLPIMIKLHTNVLIISPKLFSKPKIIMILEKMKSIIVI